MDDTVALQMSGASVLQRLADHCDDREAATAKATRGPRRSVIVQPCLPALDALQVLRMNALPLPYIRGREPRGARTTAIT